MKLKLHVWTDEDQEFGECLLLDVEFGPSWLTANKDEAPAFVNDAYDTFLGCDQHQRSHVVGVNWFDDGESFVMVCKCGNNVSVVTVEPMR